MGDDEMAGNGLDGCTRTRPEIGNCKEKQVARDLRSWIQGRDFIQSPTFSNGFNGVSLGKRLMRR